MAAPRVRVHINFKLFCWFLLVEYVICIFTRAAILLYQSGLLVSQTMAEENVLIVICSWWRAFLLLQVVTSSAWVAMERVFSVYFIVDYEKSTRLWIPAIVQACSITFSSLMSCCYTFEWVPLAPFSAIGLFFGLTGLLVYVMNNRLADILSKSLRQTNPCRVEYSLSVRYQLEENLWIAKLLKNGIITLVAANFLTFLFFVSLHIELIDRETRQLLDCLFNVFVAANGPVITCACIFNNDYVIRILKSIFCEPKIREIEDEGDLYFENLTQQWEMHFGYERMK